MPRFHRPTGSRLGSGPARFGAVDLVSWLVLAWTLSPVVATAQPEPSLVADENAAAAVDLLWSAGFDFSRGDYGLDDSTTFYYVPLGLTADIDRVRLKLTIPLLVSDGPVRFEPGGGTGGTRSDSDVSAGLGQIRVGASYLFDPLARGLPFIEVGGRLTLPTETREALGTGDVAFAAQIDLFRPIGIVSPYVSFGRKWYDSSGLRDRFYTSVGVGIELREGASVGLAYDWLESTSNDLDDAHELVPYLSFVLSERWTFGPYGVAGLSNGSPSYGVGMTVSFRP